MQERNSNAGNYATDMTKEDCSKGNFKCSSSPIVHIVSFMLCRLIGCIHVKSRTALSVVTLHLPFEQGYYPYTIAETVAAHLHANLPPWPPPDAATFGGHAPVPN